MLFAILLAAGRGRRLGQPKADMRLGGRTALERCVGALADGGADEVRVVLAAPRAVEGARVLVNPEPDRGQTSSLKLGLAAGTSGAEGFLVHTVDRPLVTADDVARLVQAWQGRPAGHSIVAPSVGGRRGHPTIFATALAAEFLALGDDEPAHRVIRADAARVLHVEFERPWMVRDIDTPEDLEAARGALGDET